jgi:hypothetical protein
MKTLESCYTALKTGGTLAFEMGAAGNVSEVHTALIAALVCNGVPIDRARDCCPWFFPSETWMRETLETIGFEVEILEREYRPTELTRANGGGLRGWIKLMGASMLEVVEDKVRRETVIDQICDILSTVVTRIEDGSQWLGYVRLRGVARKP